MMDIIEAMKLMNEIVADASGTVVKVLPENAQPPVAVAVVRHRPS